MAKIELDAKELADLCSALGSHIRALERILGTTELGKALIAELEKTLLKLDKARRKERKEISEHIT